MTPSTELSFARLAFIRFVRTGQLFSASMLKSSSVLETKFNPNHDPDNGQFTFGSGIKPTPSPKKEDDTENAVLSDGVYSPSNDPVSLLHPIATSEPPRGLTDNSGGFYDPTSLDQVFPGIETMQGGSVIAVADNILQLSQPASEMTSATSLDYERSLIADIRQYNPNFHFESLGFAETFEGQMREINDLRWDRAAAIYHSTADDSALKVETLRFLQDRTDAEYDAALAMAKVVRLPTAPTERMAIGIYVDQAVKEDFRDVLSARSLSAPVGQAVRVSGREYSSSGNDLTFSVPDARVGDTAFDISLYPKNATTPQVHRFFSSDFQPDVVIIVRPRQLGSGSTYAIKRPGK